MFGVRLSSHSSSKIQLVSAQRANPCSSGSKTSEAAFFLLEYIYQLHSVGLCLHIYSPILWVKRS